MPTVFESPADLAAAVGRSLGTSDWLEITQARIDRFAEATGDHQWIHVDPERAKAGQLAKQVGTELFTDLTEDVTYFLSLEDDFYVSSEQSIQVAMAVSQRVAGALQDALPEDAEVAGQKIRKGDRVTLWMTAANRDPAAFDDPHALDVGRTPNWHVALGGGGPHYCLGAHLARLEARVALEGLTPHLDRLRLAAPADRLRSNFFNGIKHLALAVEG